MRIVIGILITLVVLVAIGWLGLKVKPKPFAPYPAQTPELETIPLPDDLPPPVVRFDPWTGMLRFLEVMRYKEATDEAKTLWINEAREWRDIHGDTILAVGATTTWFDEGTPWLVWTVEEVVYNSDVSKYIWAAGP